MPEATTTEATQPIDPQYLRERWNKMMLTKGQKLDSPDVQSVIEKMVSSGIPPQDGDTRVEKIQDFKNIEQFNKYMSERTQHPDSLQDTDKGKASAPGEVLRALKKNWAEEDWSEFRWENQSIREVGSRLASLFNFDDIQIGNTLEILVSRGKSPSELLQVLNSAKLAEIEANLSRTEDGRTRFVSKEEVYLHFFQNLGVRQEWVMRFMMPREFVDHNEQSFHDTMPNNIEDLAWQMSHQAKEFSVGEGNPVLEMRIVKKADGTIDTENSRYYVNQANVVRWVRKEMSDYFSLSPDSAHNFFEKVHLKKRFAPISIQDMFLNESKYFTSENKNLVYKELQRQLELEVWIMSVLRQFDVEYRTAYNIEDELTKKVNQLFYNSDITKHAYGKNMWYHMLTMPLDFDSPKKGETMIGDNKLGAIINEMILAYMNFSDFEQLKQILGPDSVFFTRDGMLKAVNDMIRQQTQRLGNTTIDSFLTTKEKEALMGGFDENGKVTDQTKDKFMAFINFFTTQTPGGKTTPVIRKAMQRAMLQKYGTWNAEKQDWELLTKDGKSDGYSMTMADFAAISWWRFSGMGAINDTAFAGFDALSKVMNSEFYRAKMVDRGNASGNPYTISQFKRMVVDFMRGITTQSSMVVKDERGRVVLDKDGKVTRRNKTPYEVMMELQQLSSIKSFALRPLEAELQQSTGEERKNIEQQIAEINLEYQNVADQLTFRAEIMRDYAANHLDRGFKLYKLITNAEEADVLEKATRYDALRGVTFDRSKFQSEIQEKLFKQIRYLWNTYEEVNFNMDVRVPVRVAGPTSKPKLEYRNIKLGEAIFGHELVDRKMFWKVEDGRYVMENGKHVIDYNKVQNDKVQMWKNWALMKIAGDIHTHRALHSTDPGFNFTYYLNVIEAMKALPGEILGDEDKMRGMKVTNTLFSKADIAWLRKISGATAFNIYTRAILESMFWPKDKEGTGIGDAIANFFKAITPSGQYY